VVGAEARPPHATVMMVRIESAKRERRIASYDVSNPGLVCVHSPLVSLDCFAVTPLC
jgi:hypothetical protein